MTNCYIVEFEDGTVILFNNKKATEKCNKVKRIIEVEDNTKVIDLIGILYFTERTKHNYPHIKFKVIE